MAKQIFITLYACLLAGSIHAQSFQRASISVGSESIALPFSGSGPYHPNLEARMNLKMKESVNNLQYFNVNMGWYFHRRVEQAIYIGGEYQFSKKVFDVVSIDLPVGLGYLHSFYPGKVYEIDESGNFSTLSQSGRPHAYGTVGLGLTFLHSSKIEPFVRQDLMIETPFVNTIPVIPHTFFKAGVNLKINQSNERQ
ncbi:MAG: hypothetical protein KTR13_09475 [Saprospiraceae bacterium]|nr:hypothetical protein [Saprospiraceae bacterium]